MTDQVDALADAALEQLGPIDLLVLNAGIASRGHSIADTDPAELVRVVTTHALSAHRLIQRLLPAMRERPRGDIIAISSSELGAMRANGAPYNMAKAALEALALTLAHEEIANGIRVNIVAPGLVVTDMGSKLVKAKLGLDDISELDATQPLGRIVPARGRRAGRPLPRLRRHALRPADRRRRRHRRLAYRLTLSRLRPAMRVSVSTAAGCAELDGRVADDRVVTSTLTVS